MQNLANVKMFDLRRKIIKTWNFAPLHFPLYDIDLSCRMTVPNCRSNDIRDVKSSQQRVRTETGYFPIRYAELKSSLQQQWIEVRV